MANRRKSTARILLLVIMFSLLCHIPQINISVSADENTQLESLAVSLIIDQSGSMSETDPENMRITAANILIDLLSPEDHLGIISFNTEAMEIHAMSNVGTTTKAVFKNSLDSMGEASGDTDYVKAFEKARLQLETMADQNSRKVIIFMTDGNPDPDPSRREEAGYMDGYMDGLWNKIMEIGLSQYKVYTVGLGALNMEILDRIALETQGSSALYAQPSEVASAFFDIVTTLKNRSLFMETSEVIDGDKGIDFSMEEYISQETFLIRNHSGEMDVEFIPPNGVALDSVLKLEKSTDYTLVTINQKNGESTGDWKMKLTGSTDLSILGSKDMFAKLWIEEPVANTQQPIGEPLSISATLTGTKDDDLDVIGIVRINGVQSLTPLKVSRSDGIYTATFEDTATKGTYEIILEAVKGDKVIASTSTEVYIRLVPVLTTDLSITEKGYLLGEKRNISSALTIASVPLKGSSDVSVEYYKLVEVDEEGNEISVLLNDHGEIETGDAKADDGQYSGIVTFEDEGSHSYLLRARGTYQGEIFILERILGEADTHKPGSVEVRQTVTDIETVKGKDIYLSFRITSTSLFEEVVSFSVLDDKAELATSSVTLEPMETREVQLKLLKSDLVDGSKETLSVNAQLGQPLTELRADELSFSILQTSALTRLISRIKEMSSTLILIFGSVFLILILMYAIGMFLYHKNFKRRYFMDGKLYITEEGDMREEKQGKEIDLYSYRKPKVVITFNEKRKGDYNVLIDETRYNYDIIFEKFLEKGKFRFLDGYRSLKMSRKPELVHIRTTSPGILLVEGEVFTNAEVMTSIHFSSGEHNFRYVRNTTDHTHDDGKDILEGKM